MLSLQGIVPASPWPQGALRFYECHNGGTDLPTTNMSYHIWASSSKCLAGPEVTSAHFKPPSCMRVRVTHVSREIFGDRILYYAVSGRELSWCPFSGHFSVLGVEMQVGETPDPCSWLGRGQCPDPLLGSVHRKWNLGRVMWPRCASPVTMPICLLSSVLGSAC